MIELEHQQDVVYGYKDGMGLLMDVYQPRTNRHEAGIIVTISGGWSTNLSRRHDVLIDPEGWGTMPKCLLEAGYTIFAVAHATQPRYCVQELRPDTPRAVRFIRHHAARFGVDPARLGIVGGSSGGHVSLMTALAPPPPVDDAADPVDGESSELQAVVAYMPVTDLLNFGEEGVSMLACHGAKRAAPLDFRAFDEATGRFERVTDALELEACFRDNSPITHVSASNPPVLLLHGDQDELVPLQQSQRLQAELERKGVTHELILLPGHGHAWPAMGTGQADVVAWFGCHL